MFASLSFPYPCGAKRGAGRGGGLHTETTPEAPEHGEKSSHCLRAVVPPLRPSGLTGGQGDEAWAASVFKELRPVLGVGEPSLAL